VPSYRAEIRSAQSPEQVFDYLARFSSVAEWDASVVSAHMLTPEPVEAGSQFKVVVRSLGRELPFVYRISTFDRPHVVKLVAATGRLRSEDTITVEREGDGSKVIYDARLIGQGVAKLADPLLAVALRRIGDAAAAGLRAVITSPA
jgi:carbon monoxide dehydrogenase subunit G